VRLPARVHVQLYGVLSHEIAAVIELFSSRAEAEELVACWDQDEPELAGLLEVVGVDLAVDEN
jgi:hypothetical protein